MITCPWCGTTYTTFRSNCQNCGGPMPAPTENTPISETGVPMPPPAPRTIVNNYAWRLLLADAWAIAAFIFGFLGAIFAVLGVALTLGIVTAFVGIPFAILGFLFLGVGIAVGVWRYREAQKSIEVLRAGTAVEGQIVQVEENLYVQVNQRHPWVIRYTFHADGQPYDGQVSTLNMPEANLQPGQRVCVLYLPQTPELNVLYPRP
jgi:membrane protein implicated in regulation of membrane protease activity